MEGCKYYNVCKELKTIDCEEVCAKGTNRTSELYDCGIRQIYQGLLKNSTQSGERFSNPDEVVEFVQKRVMDGKI